MDTYELIIIIVIVFLLILWGDKQRQYFLANEFTGPTAYPLIGNIVQLWDANKNNYVEKMDKLVKKYGNLFRLFIGPYLVIVVTDPKHIEVILKSGNVNKPAIYKLMELVTNGIIIASGEKWKTLRRILNSSFQTISMENYVKLFNENGKILCEILDKNADGGVFDIERRIQNFTFDSTCKTLMSSDLDIQRKSTMMIDIANKVTLTFVYRLTHIWMIPTSIFKRTRMGKEVKVCSKQAEQFVNTIIQNRRDAHKKKEKLSDEEKEVSKQENVHIPYIDNIMNYAKSENLTDRDLCYLVFDILGAGFETSTTAICHTIMMLAIHQNIQEKVYNELTEMFGNSERDITMEDLDNMKLLQRVILESIRIAGITQMLRSVEKDIKLDCCTIPQGSTVFVPFYTLHNDKKYWSNPDEFYPDHFLPENVEKRPKFSFIPFSYGPRNCPGNKFAICQIKMSLVYILRRYRVQTDVKFSDLQYIALFMRKSPTGYPIKLLKRELSNGKSYNYNGKSYNCNGKSEHQILM